MALAAEEIKTHESFVLLDEQQVAYRLVLNAVIRSEQDEAQHMKRSKNYLESLMSITRVCVVFLDERQIIRPDEGVTLAECKAEAKRLGATWASLRIRKTSRTESRNTTATEKQRESLPASVGTGQRQAA